MLHPRLHCHHQRRGRLHLTLHCLCHNDSAVRWDIRGITSIWFCQKKLQWIRPLDRVQNAPNIDKWDSITHSTLHADFIIPDIHVSSNKSLIIIYHQANSHAMMDKSCVISEIFLGINKSYQIKNKYHSIRHTLAITKMHIKGNKNIRSWFLTMLSPHWQVSW